MKQDEEMIREAVERYGRGGVSMRELARIYRVSASTVHKWIRGREPSEEGGDGRERIRGSGAGSATGSSAGSSGSAEVRRLRKELEEARLYNELLNAMIDIAEERFEVPIRKKPGAKR